MNITHELQLDGELCFNIWFIVDIGSNLSSHCLMKTYFLNGSDNDKLDILQILADTDFLDSERFAFANGVAVTNANESKYEAVPASQIKFFFEQNIDIFLEEMESKIPPLIRFKGDRSAALQQYKHVFPDSPLNCLTFLYENEFGVMKTSTSEKNQHWIQQECDRMKLTYKF